MPTSKLMFRALLCLLFALPAAAQTAGPFTITGSQCATVSVDREATVGVQITGSWTGTIQPQGAINGNPPFNVQVTPTASSTAQSTITISGAYYAPVAGYSLFQVCGSTVTGTATVFINVSRAAH